MRTFWFRDPAPGNLGDILTPWMMARDGTHPSKARPLDPVKLYGIGSLLNLVGNEDIVWGTGAMRRTDKAARFAKYLCVRGPITAEIVRRAGGKCPEIYGDPALALPHYLPREPQFGKGECLIPHYVDKDFGPLYADQMDVLNILTANPETFVDALVGHDVVYSSTLHGLIIAHAYGIPAAWVRLSGRLAGDGTKFDDYFASVGLPTAWFPAPSLEAREHALRCHDEIRIPPIEPILERRPWLTR